MRFPFTAFAVAAASVTACQPTSRPAGDEFVKATYDDSTGRLARISQDRDRDGKADAWLFMDGVQTVRGEFDEDRNGVVDRREYYDPSKPLTRPDPANAEQARPELERTEISTRPDGATTRWEWYDAGRLARAEEDADGDGRVDKWETYVAGAVSMVAIDTRRQGKPDRRLVYPPGGGEPQLEVDPDGTGQFKPVTP